MIFIFLGMVVLCSWSCDRIYRIIQKEGAEEKDLLGEIIPFQRNAKVEEVQKLLSLYGYKIGKVDGKMGVRTRTVIEAFQKDSSLKVTRFVDKATWNKLDELSRLGLVEKGELNIKGIQAALKKAGFDPGSPDGKMGNKTKIAIIQFQQAHGLKGDGRIGYKTLNQLSQYIKQ